MASLYEINENYQSLLQAIEDGEIPDEAIADTLQAVEGEFTEKVDNIACYIKSLKADALAIKAEADTLTDRAKAKTKKADALTDYLYGVLKLSNKTKLETARNALSIKLNPPSVEIEDVDGLIKWAKVNNDDLLSYKEPTVSKTAIKPLLQAGQTIPFCSLQQGEKLTIK